MVPGKWAADGFGSLACPAGCGRVGLVMLRWELRENVGSSVPPQHIYKLRRRELLHLRAALGNISATAMASAIEFTLNGRAVRVEDVSPNTTLLNYLRT